MTTATLSGVDLELRDLVVRQLECDPEVDASHVGVAAQDGAVILSGFIGTYAGKLAAERAAKRVRGARAVANDIQVRLRHGRTDDEIAREAAQALRERKVLPQSVQAVVHGGHVTLTGHVPWMYHRVAAEVAVRQIPGVVSVSNRIDAAQMVSVADIRRRITHALHKLADINARLVNVTVTGTTATLTGRVATPAQRDAAETAAATTPGVTHVQNLIEVPGGTR